MSEHAMTWGETPTDDDRTWALLAYVSGFFAGFVGPVIVLLIYQDKSKFIKYHAVQALIAQAVVWLSAMIIMVVSWVTCGIGALLYIPWLVTFALPIWGAVRGWQGEWAGFPGVETVGR